MYVETGLKVASSVKNSYMRDAFELTWGEHIELFEEQIEGHGIEFDTVVGIGLSGMMLMPIIGSHYGCNMLALRKNGATDNHVYDNDINRIGEGSLGKKWILIDDFVAGGGTADKAIRLVNEFADAFSHKTEFMGIYGYNRGMYKSSKFYYPKTRTSGYGGYTPSSKRRIYVDDEKQFVDAILYYYVEEAYQDALKRGVENVKTYAIRQLRNWHSTFDLDTATKILIYLENANK